MLVPVALLLVLPLFGAKAMMVGSAVGMMIVSVIYRESLPGQRAYSTVICLAAAMALGSVLAVAFGR